MPVAKSVVVCVYACMCPKVRVVTGKFSYLC